MPEKTHTGKTRETLDFLLDFSIALILAGTNSARVLRNVNRIAHVLGYNVYTVILPKTLIMTVEEEFGERREHLTYVRKLAEPVNNFKLLTLLRELSWEALNKSLSLEECKERFDNIIKLSSDRLRGLKLCLTVGVAGGALSQLFGGWYCIPIVALSAFIGMALRIFLHHKKINPLFTQLFTAFVVSLIASLGSTYFDAEPDVAVSTSVLFLIPGVALLNSVIDILDGHILAGFARFINAGLLIFALSLGLALTILVTKGALL